MPELVLQIYGTLILTLAGFVLPIITIAASAFPEGVRRLRQNYENEQKQTEENLEQELIKQKNKENPDYENLSKTISVLRSAKRKAKNRIEYLNPRFILNRSFMAVGLSLCFFLLALEAAELNMAHVYLIFGALSLVFLVWSLIIFANSIIVIIEAVTVVQDLHRATEEKILELLNTVVDNTKKPEVDSLFIDPSDISVEFAGEQISEGREYTFSANKAHEIRLEILHLGEYMWKTAEMGFRFPPEFLVEGDSISDTYTGENTKIVRFKFDFLQANVRQIITPPIKMTFLKTGVFEASVFLKGENLKHQAINFKIKVID